MVIGTTRSIHAPNLLSDQVVSDRTLINLSTESDQVQTPTAFYKSRFRWNGAGWDLTLTDGTVYVFGDNAPLQAIRDRFGNTLTVQHVSGQTGNLTRIVSPNNRWVAFTYDTAGRITQALDNIGRTVGYQY